MLKRLVTFRVFKSASEAALFVSTAAAPDNFFMVWRPDAGADKWDVAAVNPRRVPADRERLSITAPELSKGFYVALNSYFRAQVAIQ